MYSKEYKAMLKKYRDNAARNAQEISPWDFCWSLDYLINHLEFMRDYYALGENVHSMEDCEWKQGEHLTRLEKINLILVAYHDWADFTYDHNKDIHEETMRYNLARDVFFATLSRYIESLWD